MRIALIHALPVSIAPIEEAFERLWPEANTVNLTDDSLAGDLAAAGTLQPEMTDRFLALARYSAQGLDQMVTIVAGATLLSYAVYTTDPNTIETFGTDLLTLTIPFPIYGVLRYLLIMREHPLAGPSDLLLKDHGLTWCAVGWSVAVALIIYRPLG